jgi:sigma-B regulation protein RsbU (phosphoserine phosphatase)
MKRLFHYIQHRLSLRLGLLIVLIVTVVFSLLFDFLFYRCKRYIQNAAIDRATQLLDNTAERINGIMSETEVVTNYMAVTTPRHLAPDSLLAFTRQITELNSVMQGFTIALEPGILPGVDQFTAYSYRTADSLVSLLKNDYDYFLHPWYKTPVESNAGCWLEPYRYAVPDIDPEPVWYFSYTTPLRDIDGRLIGVACADLSLHWLSQAVSSVKPFPNSSAIMVGHDGRYLVHPDSSKIIRESIFSDPDPASKHQIETLGRAMIAGRSGMVETIVDGAPAFIFYRPVERTGWSIAIVCPESDVFARYNRLLIITWLIIAIGLILLMLFCYQIVRRAVQPLRQLDEQAKRIAEGHFDEPLSQSSRHDSVGRLQNSFILMQKSLAQMVNDIRIANDELEQHNEELTHAYQLKLQTNRRKSAFIRDMYHQIRTPLNIIAGFAQVLAASLHGLSAEEVSDITSRMKESANDISRLTCQLDEITTDNPTNKE